MIVITLDWPCRLLLLRLTRYAVCCVMQTSGEMPTSEFIPANCRPPVNSDSAQGMRSTYPAAMRAAQFGANNLISSQIASRGSSSISVFSLNTFTATFSVDIIIVIRSSIYDLYWL